MVKREKQKLFFYSMELASIVLQCTPFWILVRLSISYLSYRVKNAKSPFDKKEIYHNIYITKEKETVDPISSWNVSSFKKPY